MKSATLNTIVQVTPHDPCFSEQTHSYGGQREMEYGASGHDFSNFFKSMLGGHTQEATALLRMIYVDRILI